MNVAMTCPTTDPFRDVNAMIEVREVGQIVDFDPFERLVDYLVERAGINVESPVSAGAA